jgi:hypothetical protein
MLSSPFALDACLPLQDQTSEPKPLNEKLSRFQIPMRGGYGFASLHPRSVPGHSIYTQGKRKGQRFTAFIINATSGLSASQRGFNPVKDNELTWMSDTFTSNINVPFPVGLDTMTLHELRSRVFDAVVGAEQDSVDAVVESEPEHRDMLAVRFTGDFRITDTKTLTQKRRNSYVVRICGVDVVPLPFDYETKLEARARLHALNHDPDNRFKDADHIVILRAYVNRIEGLKSILNESEIFPGLMEFDPARTPVTVKLASKVALL